MNEPEWLADEETDDEEMDDEEMDDEEMDAENGSADEPVSRFVSPEERDAAIARAETAERDAFLKKHLGPELEGWIMPSARNDPYDGLNEQLFQLRNMVRYALIDYFRSSMRSDPGVAMGIARLMQTSASLARALKQGPPKVITLPAVDVTNSKTVHGGAARGEPQD